MSRDTRQILRPRRRAFTLLELLVALGLVVMVAGTLFASLQIANNAPRRAQAMLDSPRTADLTLTLLQNDLQSAFPPTGTLAGSFTATQSHDNRGHEADDVIFFGTADSPQHPSANGEIKQIELTMIATADGRDHVLVRKVTRNLLAQVQPTPDEEVLCRNVGSFTLEYFTGSQWLAVWDSTQEDATLPAAVRITLELDRPATAVGGAGRSYRFVRILPVPCSTAAIDPTVNTGGTTQ